MRRSSLAGICVMLASFCVADGHTADFSTLATPIGVTLQPSGKGRYNTDYVYADSSGLALYTNESDAPDKSNCVDACLSSWSPARPVAGAQPVGDWKIVKHPNGEMQWTYKAKPLYRFAMDKEVGDSNGADTAWRLARFQPAADVLLPVGFSLANVPNAAGYVLVNAKGLTLYTFAGKANDAKYTCGKKACFDRMEPVVAAQLARPIGDWSVIQREDGIQQWAFKGAPLYAFSGDLQAGDINGADIDSRWQVARAVRYPMPESAQIRAVLGRGMVLATSEGMTLYRRDRYLFAGPGIPKHPDTMAMSPLMGRAIGTKGCGPTCLASWRPFEAPADAQPTGFWEIAVRDDGARQWVYQGYALYTHTGDKKPGDVNGNGQYEILMTGDARTKIDDFGTAQFNNPEFNANMPTLFWWYAYP